MIPPALDRLLAALSVEITAFAICRIAGDAEILVPRLGKIEVHHVLDGTLHLLVEDCPPIVAGPGSVVIVPAGRAQRMAGTPRPARSLAGREICAARSDGFMIFDTGGTDPGGARVMCGEIRADVSGVHDLFHDMSGPLASEPDATGFVPPAFSTLLAEADRPGAASRALCGALMKACLVLVLRQHVAERGTKMLPGLFRRPWLGKAVSAVLDAPAAVHSVASLASLSGRSRSVFAKEFGEDLGITPMEFVMQVRLARARELLELSALPVGAVANQVGFTSRSHFSRAFRATFGVDPTAWRRRRVADLPCAVGT